MLKLNKKINLRLFGAFICLFLHAEIKANEENISKSSTPGHLDEVLVTAERRETDAQKTPVSIAIFTSENIDDLNITQTSDLALRTPGLTIGNSGSMSFPEIRIRGVGTADFSTGADLSIGYYVDDVYIGRSGNMFVDLFDLDRIEILKGPQGTLWGRNAVGGAINIITTKPSHEFETKHQVTYGNFDLFRLTGNVSGPLISNKILAKFSYNVRDRDGYTDNIFHGNDIGDADNISARTNLLFLPTDNLELLLNFDYSKDRPTGVGIKSTVTGDPVLSGFFGNVTVNDAPFNHVEPAGAFNVNQDAMTQENRDLYGVSANLTWRFNDLSLKSISAYRKSNFNLLDNIDGVSLKLLDFNQSIDQEQFTQELRLSNENNHSLKWLIGSYFFREQSKDSVMLDLQDFELLVGAGDYSVTNFAKTVSYSYSLFGQTTYNFTDRFSTTVGARYTYEEKDFETRRVSDDVSGLINPSFPLTRFDDDWQAFTPKFVIQFQQSEDILYYGSISRGFRSGGFNSLQSVLQNSFDPEFLMAYELGLKSRWLDQRLQLNLSGFYYNHRDLQVQTVIAGAQIVTTNAAKAKDFGAEIELSFIPADRLYLYGGLSLLNARYKEFINASSIDVSNNVINNSPDVSSTLVVQYTLLLKNLGYLTIGGEHQFQSEVFFTETNETILSQTGYHNFNARAQFQTYDEKFTFTLYGENLTDEETANFGSDLRDTLGTVNKFFNPPRTFGARVAIKF